MQKATRLYPRSSAKLALAAARYGITRTALASAFFDSFIDENGIIADVDALRKLRVDSEPFFRGTPVEPKPDSPTT